MARVKWFNSEKGFGFVEMTDGSGEAFLHIRQVEAAGHSNLPSGSTLTVQVRPGQKGPQVNAILHADTSTAEHEPPRREPRDAGRPSQPRRPGGAPITSPDTMGTVKWFDDAKGFGFVAVEGEGKDLFVHVSVLQRAGLTQLAQGQTVRVAIVEGRKGREVGTIELV